MFITTRFRYGSESRFVASALKQIADLTLRKFQCTNTKSKISDAVKSGSVNLKIPLEQSLRIKFILDKVTFYN